MKWIKEIQRGSHLKHFQVPSNKCLEIFYFVKEKRRHYCKNWECRIFFETPTRMYKIYNVYNIWYTWYRWRFNSLCVLAVLKNCLFDCLNLFHRTANILLSSLLNSLLAVLRNANTKTVRNCSKTAPKCQDCLITAYKLLK